MLNKVSCTRLFAQNGSHFLRKWFLLNSFGGNVLLRGELQIDAKNSNFENFKSALYMKSGSMFWDIAENVTITGIPISSFLRIYITASSPVSYTYFCLWRVNKKEPRGETPQMCFTYGKALGQKSDKTHCSNPCVFSVYMCNAVSKSIILLLSFCKRYWLVPWMSVQRIRHEKRYAYFFFDDRGYLLTN